MADAYRRRQQASAVTFDAARQRVMVDTARHSGEHIDATVYAVATEPTHTHVLVSWKHERTWRSMRASIRSSLTRRLNEQFGKREWFSDSPSRKRVRDREHFDYLVSAYLPRHGGAKWFAVTGATWSPGYCRITPVT